MSEEKPKVILKDFSYNYTKAETLASFEMISPPLAVLHDFCKRANKDFKDRNQKDKCLVGNKTVFLKQQVQTSEIDLFDNEQNYDYVLIWEKAKGNIVYLGYITREEIKNKEESMHGKAQKLVKKFHIDGLNHMSELLPIWIEEQEEKIIVKQNYTPLHCHTEYSIGDAYGDVKTIAKTLKERGFDAGSITDHGSLAGVIYFQKALMSEGLKPLIGIEAYVVMDDNVKSKYRHITLYAKNVTGWKTLLRLNEKAMTEGFYYKPKMHWTDLLNNSDGLIMMSGCLSSPFHRALTEGDESLCREYFKQAKEAYGEDFYVEVMPNRIPEQVKNNKTMIRLADEYKVKIVASLDAHYPNKEDKVVHDALKAISMRKQFGEAGYDDSVFYLLTRDEIQKLLREDHGIDELLVNEMLENTNEIANKCELVVTKERDNTLPKLYEDGKAKLKELAIQGLNENTNYFYPEVKERFDMELGRFVGKHYEDYFLIVDDYVRWCKANDVLVGPGRGSVGGSLVAYALGITTVDPLEHDLLFDRFISEVRKDAPDIDLDFQDDKRQDLLNYLKDKYGKRNTCKIITYARWHGKGALRDIGRIFKIPEYETNKIANLVVTRSGGDARSDFCLTDTFTEFEQAKDFYKKYKVPCDIAVKLEGRIRHRGIHAAGLIITDVPTAELVPVENLKGELCTAWEKKEVENFGLIKFDILGLKTLSVIKEAMRIADITSLPKKFDDAKVYDEVFKTGKTLGVFQFETSGLSKLSKQLNLDSFKTLYDATTLYRPGPLHCGETADYIQRHKKMKEWDYDHKLLESITRDTYGLILYQEQVMKVMFDLGKFSWATAESARKIMTKSQGKDAFNKMRVEFCNNAEKEHGLPQEESSKIFDVVSTFGSYGFNKSHAVEYSIISYWCAWLKTYHPKEFYCAVMSRESDDGMLNNYLREAKTSGINILPIDINKSKNKFTPEESGIRVGFACIKGIGEAVVQRWIQQQPYRSVSDFLVRATPNKSHLEALASIGVFDSTGKTRRQIFEQGKEAFRQDRQATLFNYSYDSGKLLEDLPEWDEKTKFEKQLEYLPYQHEQNLIDFFEDPFESLIVTQGIDELNTDEKHDEVWIKGVVTFINFKQEGLEGNWTMFDNLLERRYAHLNVNDGFGNILVHLSPEQYTFYKKYLERTKDIPVLVKGHINAGFNKIHCDGMVVLDDINWESSLIRYIKGESKQILQEMISEDTSNKHGIIQQVTYRVSKNGKPYARIRFTDDNQRMCFKLDENIFVAGEVVRYKDQDPFMEVLERR